MSVRLERLARNQVLFREVNERLREVLDGSTAMPEFLCECSNTDCTETVPLDLPAYESIRASSTHFLVASGHELPQIERVVAESDGHCIVEKIVGSEYAARNDPRSRSPQPS